MLQEGVDFFFYSVLGLDSSLRWVQSLNFFVYDSIKIILLLFVMIAIIGYVRSYISEARLRKLLSGKNKTMGYIGAGIFGAVTPYCSCSSIPIFLSFIKARIPIGVSFSFLMSSPLVDQYLVALMLGIFGWKITAVYVVGGIVVGIVTGIVIEKLNMEKYLVHDIAAQKEARERRFSDIRERAKYGIEEATSIVKKLWIWILFGVGVGAVIHNYVPAEAIHGAIASAGIMTVPVAVMLGIPVYGGCAAILPIALVLFQKGIPLGTALAFMMSVTSLSLPEAIILRRAMRLELIAVFFLVVAISIMGMGYLINVLQPILA